MRLEPFALERMQSTWENRVAWNLSESGVHPLRVEELANTDSDRMAVLSQDLGYPQTNGTPELRAAIASLYHGASAAHIEVTNGGSEANLVVLSHLIDPGDEVVMMLPNYMQMRGLARGLGAVVRPWTLTGGEGGAAWRLNFPALEELVSTGTKVIAICNPNNPTGARFSENDLDAVVRVASRVGAWIVSDEIYRGAEMDGVEPPTMWGRTDRVIVTSGLSKAYGLPGLRIGWIAGPPDVIASLWSYHDYTTIAPGALSDALARHALEPARRRRILARTRDILNRNFPAIAEWLDAQGGAFSYSPPDAGAIVYARYHYPINSTELVTRLRTEKSVLVVPGDHFGMDGYLRIGFGDSPAYLHAALDRVGDLLCSI